MGVSVAPIGRHAIEPLAFGGFVLGFSGIAPAEIEGGVRRLEQSFDVAAAVA